METAQKTVREALVMREKQHKETEFVRAYLGVNSERLELYEEGCAGALYFDAVDLWFRSGFFRM